MRHLGTGATYLVAKSLIGLGMTLSSLVLRNKKNNEIELISIVTIPFPRAEFDRSTRLIGLNFCDRWVILLGEARGLVFV